MDIISRLKKYMEYSGLSSSQFADRAGIPRPTLSQLFNGRNKSDDSVRKISSELLKKLHDAFPDLNIMWLLFSDGDMVSNENNEFSEPENAPKKSEFTHYNSDNHEIQQQIFFDDDFHEFSPKKSIPQPQTSNNVNLLVADNPINDSSIPGKNQTEPKHSVNIKKVQSIMIFYDDNSFEIFKHSE